MGGVTACCTSANASEEERLKQAYLDQLKQQKTNLQQPQQSSIAARSLSNASNMSSLQQSTPRRKLRVKRDEGGETDDVDEEVDEIQGSGMKSAQSSMSSQLGAVHSSGGSRQSSNRDGLTSQGSGSKGSNSSPRKGSSRYDQLRELVGEIVANMGYDGMPIMRIKANKYLIGTEVQYLQQIGSLVVVLDKSTGQEQSPLSQFLAENVIHEVQAVQNLMSFHDKNLVQTIEMLVAKHSASQDVVGSVKRQVSQDRYIELQNYISQM